MVLGGSGKSRGSTGWYDLAHLFTFPQNGTLPQDRTLAQITKMTPARLPAPALDHDSSDHVYGPEKKGTM